MGQNGELARMKQPELSVRLSPGLAATGRRLTVSPVTRVTRRGGKERSGFAFLWGPGNRPLGNRMLDHHTVPARFHSPAVHRNVEA